MLSVLRPPSRQEHGASDPVAQVAPSSVELLAGARAGDSEAIEELYRLHRPVAHGVARGLCRPDDVDDVVAEAFVRVLDQIAHGRGPRVSFRAYLITAVRSAATDLARKNARLVWSDELDGEENRGPEDARPDSTVRHESALLGRALEDLPPRWQLVLWWTTVERRSLAEVGELLDINANAAAALAFRARDGLREAYLRLHVPPAAHPECAAAREELVTLARARPAHPLLSLSLTRHLDACATCQDVAHDLRDARAGAFARP